MLTLQAALPASFLSHHQRKNENTRETATEVDSRMLYPVDRFTVWLNLTRPSDTEYIVELCSRRKGAPQLSTDQLYYH
jgi:hypothetical protein